jgi:hypothetical protein
MMDKLTLRIGQVCAIVLSILIVGCSGIPIQLSAVTQAQSVDTTKGRSLTASASGFQLLLFIPISINSRHERALQDLRTQAGMDAIADVKISESWTYAFVGTVYTTTIQATAYPKAP